MTPGAYWNKVDRGELQQNYWTHPVAEAMGKGFGSFVNGSARAAAATVVALHNPALGVLNTAGAVGAGAGRAAGQVAGGILEGADQVAVEAKQVASDLEPSNQSGVLPFADSRRRGYAAGP